MRKIGFGHMPKAVFFAAAIAAVLFAGCGKTSNNLGGAADWYNDSVYGSGTYGTDTYTGGGTAYWDGYGINGGRSMAGGSGTGSTGSTGYGSISNGFSGTADDVYGLGSLPGTTGGATASVLD